jgi:hypothetical protein
MMRDFDRVLHNRWDRVLEAELPDSRLSGPRRRATSIVRAGVVYEACFCANCGKPHGLITADWSPHVFFLCDGCFAAGGTPAGCGRVDEDLIPSANRPGSI